MSDDSDEQRQCGRGVDVHELDAAMALADMAGVGPDQVLQQPPPPAAAPVQHALAAAASSAAAAPPPQMAAEDEELASTRLSLELGKVGIQSSPCCSSSSSAGHHHHHHPAQQPLMPATAAAAAAATAVSGYGPRPRHMLTEAEKEAKRLRRVLANRESARQTILRRQAIRDELARKVADLSSQNEIMQKEKDQVMQEYLSLKEANRKLKQQQQQQQVGRATKKAAAAATPVSAAVHVSAPSQSQRAASVPYVWGSSWPPTAAAGYERAGSPAAPLCLPPCAWYYPVVVADPPGGGTAVEEEDANDANDDANDDDDDPCSLTLAIDKRSAPVAVGSSSSSSRGGAGAGPPPQQQAGAERDKAATAAEARKRRKEVTKLKHTHAAAGRPGGEQW